LYNELSAVIAVVDRIVSLVVVVLFVNGESCRPRPLPSCVCAS